MFARTLSMIDYLSLGLQQRGIPRYLLAMFWVLVPVVCAMSAVLVHPDPLNPWTFYPAVGFFAWAFVVLLHSARRLEHDLIRLYQEVMTVRRHVRPVFDNFSWWASFAIMGFIFGGELLWNPYPGDAYLALGIGSLTAWMLAWAFDRTRLLVPGRLTTTGTVFVRTGQHLSDLCTQPPTDMGFTHLNLPLEAPEERCPYAPRRCQCDATFHPQQREV